LTEDLVGNRFLGGGGTLKGIQDGLRGEGYCFADFGKFAMTGTTAMLKKTYLLISFLPSTQQVHVVVQSDRTA
jgi:hypothetical protein